MADRPRRSERWDYMLFRNGVKETGSQAPFEAQSEKAPLQSKAAHDYVALTR